MAQPGFVIVTHGRTGSSLLVGSLRGAGVSAFGELMHDDEHARAEAALGAVNPYRAEADGAEFLRDFYATGDGPRGFKLLYEQARTGPAATAWDFIRDHPEIALIHLVRRDLLASWISYEVARRTDVWAPWADEQAPPELPPFEIDADELERFFDRVVAQRAWVRHALQRPAFLEIRYEEGLRDRFGPSMQRILGHIGATGVCQPHPALLRLSRGPVERQISNFAELRARFRHTPHEEYFERPYATGRTAAHPGFCARPFEFLAVDAKGKLRVCCEDWLPTSIGDVRSGSPMQQWNSATAVAIRESILDGSYRFCHAKQCPDLVKGTLPPIDALSRERHRSWPRDGRTVLEEPPRTLSLGYDPSCNLKCPTCRDDFIVLKGASFERAAAIQEVVLAELLPSARLAIITGHGDAVASRLYRSFLRRMDASKLPELRILLMTNGLTLDPIMWDSFRAAHPAIAGVSISIDAASAETYALNRGGSFDKLLRNLRFLGSLRRRGKIDFFEISFVVQANNFREMPDFVRLAQRVECSSVLFMKLIHWPGTFSAAELARRAVHEPEHPRHREFLQVLQEPILGAPGVDLSNLSDLRAAPPREATCA
jgi:LPS sulfotransferase NodH